jgi:hypothetical protein
MSNPRRVSAVLAGFVAAAALALAASTASATKLEVTNQRIRIVWSSLRITLNNANAFIACPITIEGSFQSKTILKLSSLESIGDITKAEVAPPASCTTMNTNEVELSEEWTIRYAGFTGVLPRIERIRLRFIVFGVGIRTTGFGFCIYGQGAEGGMYGWLERNNENSEISAFAFDNTVLIPKAPNQPFCPEHIKIEGSGSVRLLGTTTIIGIRLIM